jgi:N-acetylglucosaminyldiphosphoundecaprenol N-acetyl-beta-D-mannosaminyltransferase
MNTKHQSVFFLRLSLITFSDFLKALSDKNTIIRGYCCFANVHMCIEVYRNIHIRNSVNNANFVLSDGIPLVFTLNLLYNIKQERIAGMDFMPRMFSLAEMYNESVFFYGSSSEVLERLHSKIQIEFPGLKVVGKISPPYRNLSEDENQFHIDQINISGARYVFVSLGCPKQELWMAKNSNKINAILLGVGGAFDVYADVKRRAPIWLRNIGLEWFFRLLQEPRRLWKRYLKTNSLFILLVLSELFKKHFQGH